MNIIKQILNEEFNDRQLTTAKEVLLASGDINYLIDNIIDINSGKSALDRWSKLYLIPKDILLKAILLLLSEHKITLFCFYIPSDNFLTLKTFEMGEDTIKITGWLNMRIDNNYFETTYYKSDKKIMIHNNFKYNESGVKKVKNGINKLLTITNLG